MKKIVVVVLTILYCLTISLYAELNVMISEQNEITPPFDFRHFFCEGEESIHFYNNIIENGHMNLYHFTLNSDFSYSSQTLLESINIQGTFIDNIKMYRLHNSDCIHIAYEDDDDRIQRMSMLSDFDQISGSVDLATSVNQINSYLSVSDSVFVYQRNNYGNSSSQYYKHNLLTDNYEMFTSRTNNYHIERMWNLFAIPRSEENSSFQGYCLYNEQVELINTVELATPSQEFTYLFYSEREHEDIPFGNGFVTSYYTFGDNPNCPAIYVELINNELIVNEINQGIYYTKAVGSGALYSLYYDWGGDNLLHCIRSQYDGESWTNIDIGTCLSNKEPLVIDDLVIYTYSYGGNDVTFTIFDDDEIGDIETCTLSGGLGYYPTYMFGKIFCFAPGNSSNVSYFNFGYTYPNSDDSNPALNTIVSSNYPNPFNPTTTIEYSVPETGNVSIDIYNILGQRVDTLINSEHSKGTHTIQWDGVDDNQNALSSGIYFYKVSQNGKSVTKKIVMMK